MPEPEQNSVDLPSEGQSVAVEIDKDAISSVADEVEGSEEHEAYSAKVQKRIDKLTKKLVKPRGSNKLQFPTLKVFRKRTLHLKVASTIWMWVM